MIEFFNGPLLRKENRMGINKFVLTRLKIKRRSNEKPKALLHR